MKTIQNLTKESKSHDGAASFFVLLDATLRHVIGLHAAIDKLEPAVHDGAAAVVAVRNELALFRYVHIDALGGKEGTVDGGHPLANS